MPREAALTARLGLDDSDIRKKIDAQSSNYNKLLQANQAFQKKLAAQNTAARAAELAAEKAAYEKSSAMARASAFTAGGPVIARGDLEARLQSDQRAAILSRSQRALGTGIGGLKLKGAGPDFTDPSFINRTKTSIDGLTRSTLSANSAMMQTRGGATNAGMGMLFLAQGIDDAQYGFRSIVNNIAPLVMALGGGAGLAGVLTIAAVGFNLLGKAASDALDAVSGDAERLQMILNNTAREENNKRIRAENAEARKLQGETEERIREGLEKSEDMRRANAAADLEYKLKALELEEQIAQAKLTGADNAAVINEREKRLMEKRLEIERQFYEERLHNNRGDSPEAAARRESDTASLADVRRRQGLVPAQQALMDQNLNNNNAMAMSRKGITAVLNFFGDMHDRAAAANKADEAAWKDQQDAARREAAMNKQTGIELMRLNAQGATGPRRIKGAVSNNLKTGINGEFHSGPANFAGFQDMSQDYFGLKEASTQKRTQQNAKLQKINEGLSKAEASGDKATVTELRAMKTALVQKLDELNQSTMGTAGERTAPAASH